MATIKRKEIAYNPLYDGVDAAKEVAASKKKRLRSGTKEKVKGSAGTQIGGGQATAATAAGNTTDLSPVRQSGGGSVFSADAGAAVAAAAAVELPTVATVTPPGRTYELTGPAAAIVPQMYVARDLRSMILTAPLGMTLAEMTCRFDAGDSNDGVRVSRLTPEIWQSIEQQCRKMYDDARGRWHEREIRERVLLMLDRVGAVRDWARGQGWPVHED